MTSSSRVTRRGQRTAITSFGATVATAVLLVCAALAPAGAQQTDPGTTGEPTVTAPSPMTPADATTAPAETSPSAAPSAAPATAAEEPAVSAAPVAETKPH